MGRTLEEVMQGLPPDRQRAAEARSAELILDIEGLRQLRSLNHPPSDTLEDLLNKAARTVNAPLPIPIAPSDLADALSRRNGADFVFRSYLRCFFEEVDIDLIHRLVLAGGSDFVTLYGLVWPLGIDNQENECFIREMAFLEKATPRRLPGPNESEC